METMNSVNRLSRYFMTHRLEEGDSGRPSPSTVRWDTPPFRAARSQTIVDVGGSPRTALLAYDHRT
jgi:hypothetical protein